MANIKPGHIGLSHHERLWVGLKWDQIRKRQELADSASNAWTELNDALNQKLDGDGTFDPVQRDRVKGLNLELSGHLATHGWNAREAQRHIDDVNLFLRMKELGVL